MLSNEGREQLFTSRDMPFCATPPRIAHAASHVGGITPPTVQRVPEPIVFESDFHRTLFHHQIDMANKRKAAEMDVWHDKLSEFGSDASEIVDDARSAAHFDDGDTVFDRITEAASSHATSSCGGDPEETVFSARWSTTCRYKKKPRVAPIREEGEETEAAAAAAEVSPGPATPETVVQAYHGSVGDSPKETERAKKAAEAVARALAEGNRTPDLFVATVFGTCYRVLATIRPAIVNPIAGIGGGDFDFVGRALGNPVASMAATPSVLDPRVEPDFGPCEKGALFVAEPRNDQYSMFAAWMQRLVLHRRERKLQSPLFVVFCTKSFLECKFRADALDVCRLTLLMGTKAPKSGRERMLCLVSKELLTEPSFYVEYEPTKVEVRREDVVRTFEEARRKSAVPQNVTCLQLQREACLRRGEKVPRFRIRRGNWSTAPAAAESVHDNMPTPSLFAAEVVARMKELTCVSRADWGGGEVLDPCAGPSAGATGYECPNLTATLAGMFDRCELRSISRGFDAMDLGTRKNPLALRGTSRLPAFIVTHPPASRACVITRHLVELREKHPHLVVGAFLSSATVMQTEMLAQFEPDVIMMPTSRLPIIAGDRSHNIGDALVFCVWGAKSSFKSLFLRLPVPRITTEVTCEDVVATMDAAIATGRRFRSADVVANIRRRVATIAEEGGVDEATATDEDVVQRTRDYSKRVSTDAVRYFDALESL